MDPLNAQNVTIELQETSALLTPLRGSGSSVIGRERMGTPSSLMLVWHHSGTSVTTTKPASSQQKILSDPE